MPGDVVRLEICDPSGLLPTRSCERTIPEVFLLGTEPSSLDTYYQPVAVNRETGRRATLWTSLSLVEERDFVNPPAEALAWARENGLPLAPDEYDSLPAVFPYADRLHLRSPAPLDVVHGQVEIIGSAATEGMSSFRVQAGAGLYPSAWVLVGQGKQPVQDARLAMWSTQGLGGVYSIQLLAVEESGQAEAVSIPVTVDNEPPVIRILSPAGSSPLAVAAGEPLIVQADVEDNLGVQRVEFLWDGQIRTVFELGPYSARWDNLGLGTHQLSIRAYDGAGNMAASDRLSVTVQTP